MKQYGVSLEDVIKFFKKEISGAWKDVNEEMLKPTAVPVAVLTRVLNLCRVVDVLYNQGQDAYTNAHGIRETIQSLLLKPFLL